MNRAIAGAVAVFGAVGAVLRYGIGLALAPWTAGFPFATLTVNLLGCFALGWLATGWRPSGTRAIVWHKGLTTGLIGSFTTFSAFGVDAVMLAEQGAWGAAAAYVVLSAVGGFAAAWAGIRAAMRKEQGA